MKELLCKPKELNKEQQSTIELASELGFKKATNILKNKRARLRSGCIIITEENIKTYLRKKLAEYCEAQEELKEKSKTGKVKISYPSKDGLEASKIIGRLKYSVRWVEIEIKAYTQVPPLFVLERIKKHAHDFDELTIATIRGKTETIVKDPLLLGRNENDDNRYFLAQWDNDILLDDII